MCSIFFSFLFVGTCRSLCIVVIFAYRIKQFMLRYVTLHVRYVTSRYMYVMLRHVTCTLRYVSIHKCLISLSHSGSSVLVYKQSTCKRSGFELSVFIALCDILLQFYGTRETLSFPLQTHMNYVCFFRLSFLPSRLC